MRAIESVVLLLLIGLNSAQVIGIDLGTEFWKASLISPGKNLVIVENSRSSRKSHNGVPLTPLSSPSSKASAISSTTPSPNVKKSPRPPTSI